MEYQAVIDWLLWAEAKGILTSDGKNKWGKQEFWFDGWPKVASVYDSFSCDESQMPANALDNRGDPLFTELLHDLDKRNLLVKLEDILTFGKSGEVTGKKSKCTITRVMPNIDIQHCEFTAVEDERVLALMFAYQQAIGD